MENFHCANKAGWRIHNSSKSESPYISAYDDGIVGKTLGCASGSLIQGPSLLGLELKKFPRILEDFQRT
ncbi:hypothetical protein N7507_006570 [Penicillium longicatenatum]|nr:hypothetical protein N7507_006570 [Penicillium longicatenatum]